MFPRVYIHIGMPKAASSFLQLEFFPNIDEPGFHFEGGRATRNDKILGSLLRYVNETDERARSKYRKKLVDLQKTLAAQGVTKIILSHESLCGLFEPGYPSLTLDKIVSIQSVFPNLRILFVARNQLDFLKSYWTQTYVHNPAYNGSSQQIFMPLLEYVSRIDDDVVEGLNYYRFIESLRSDLGLDVCLTFFEYLEKETDSSTFLNDIGSFLEISGFNWASKISLAKKINVSLDEKNEWIVRAIRKIYVGRGIIEGIIPSVFKYPLLNRLADFMARTSPKKIKAENVFKDLTNHWASSNKNLLKTQSVNSNSNLQLKYTTKLRDG